MAEEPPAKRIKIYGKRGVPPTWMTDPSLPWPFKGHGAQEGVRYHDDSEGVKSYYLFNGRQRRPICQCKRFGACGLIAQSKTKPGYAHGCVIREARKESLRLAKQNNSGILPPWKGKNAHVGNEDFVLHKGIDCLTRQSTGDAFPLCACGECLVACSSFKQKYAISCTSNPDPVCVECEKYIARIGGYCTRCADLVEVTAKRKSEREPEVIALLAKYPMLKRAPDDIANAVNKQGYVQLNVQDDWKPKIVVKIGNGKTAEWNTGCVHGLIFKNCGDCMSFDAMVESKIWCSGCNTRLSDKRKHIGWCATCDDGKTKIARTEIRLRGGLIDAVGHPASALDDTFFGNDKTVCGDSTWRRPDAAWLGTDRVVLCETDEHCHAYGNYSPQCDATWATDMAEALVNLYNYRGHNGHALRIFLVRWNPDARDQSRPQVRVEDRVKIVGAKVKALLEMSEAELAAYAPSVPHVYYYFYHSNAQAWIDKARSSGGIAVQDVVE